MRSVDDRGTAGPMRHFERHDADGPTVCEHGATISRTADGFDRVATGVRRRNHAAVGVVEGDLVPPMTSAPTSVIANAKQLRRAAEVGGAAVTMWGVAVGEFNSAVDVRNARVEAEKTPEAQRDRYQALLPEHRGDVAELESTADDVARVLANPESADSITTLWRAGLLPASSRDLFDGITLPRGDEMQRHLTDLVRNGTLPADILAMDPTQLADYLENHPDLAAKVSRLDLDGLPDDVPGADLKDTSDPATIRRILNGMDPDDAATLALIYSKDLRNTNGVPFHLRALGNNVAVTAERRRLLAELGNLGPFDRTGGPGDRGRELGHRLEQDQITKRLALLDSILRDDRQILHFRPRAAGGDGEIVELHGQIGPHTRNALVYVPGTTIDSTNFDGQADRTNGFIDRRGRETLADGSPNDLVGITWLGSDMPDNVLTDAPMPGYSEDAAPKLADFSHQLRTELDAAGADSGKVTAMGHSYGGATVGLAENEGLDADRILHVNSAGMGHGINDTDDLHAPKDRDRYSMTVPRDFIDITNSGQDVQRHTGGVLTNTHGADPDHFEGTIEISPGNDENGNDMKGPLGSHSKPFQQKNSDAWQNMYDIATGKLD